MLSSLVRVGQGLGDVRRVVPAGREAVRLRVVAALETGQWAPTGRR